MMRRKRQRGNALIEMALAMVVLVPIFLGVFQFGLAFFYYNQLASAVRAGARYASYLTYDSPSATPSNAYQQAVRNMTVYGNPRGGAQPVVSNLTPAHINVSVTAVNGVPRYVRVGVREFSMNVILRTLKVSRPEAEFPYLGVYSPAI
jgi:Flp pilus assembly protein TadG